MGRRHEIRILHEVGPPAEVYRVNEVLDATVRICKLCATPQRTLSFRKKEVPIVAEPSDSTPSDRKAISDELIESCRNAADALRRLNDEYFGGTDFEDIDAFARELEKRYLSSIAEDDVTFSLARHWLDADNAPKNIKRKILLVLKQGFVCNRCDEVFLTRDDFEMDHIIPKSKKGQTVLKNLQLLCKKCHKNKGNEDPIPYVDCSPYDDAYDSPACVHELNCTELLH